MGDTGKNKRKDPGVCGGNPPKELLLSRMLEGGHSSPLSARHLRGKPLIPVSSSTLSRDSPHDEREQHGRFWKWTMIRGALGGASWETVVQDIGAGTSEMGQLQPLGPGTGSCQGEGEGASENRRTWPSARMRGAEHCGDPMNSTAVGWAPLLRPRWGSAGAPVRDPAPETLGPPGGGSQP